LASAMDRSDVVVVTGPTGIGKSALVAEVMQRHPGFWLAGMAGLASRPLSGLRRMLSTPVTDGGIGPLADQLVAQIGESWLVVDDAQFVDGATLAVIGRAQGRISCVFTVRSGEAGAADLLESFRDQSAAVIELGPLGRPDAIRLAAAAGATDDEASALYAVARGHPMWTIHAAGGRDAATTAVAVAATVDRLEPAARTVLAALGLLGRPALAGLLGDGVDAAAAAGLVRIDADMVVPTHQLYAEVAVARSSEADRRSLHLALAVRLADHGEASIHFAAAGDLTRALGAARAAVEQPDHDDVSLARHLALVASLSGSDSDVSAAAAALLQAGDAAGALRWCAGVDDDSDDFPAVAVTAARAARTIGDEMAGAWAERGLRRLEDGTDEGDGSVRRRLLVERLHVRGGSPDEVDQVLAACRGFAEEGAAQVAVAACSVVERSSDWELDVVEAIAVAEACGDVDAELDGRWLHVVATAAGCRLTAAAALAREGAARAALRRPSHAAKFLAEAAWLEAVSTSTPAPDAPDAALALCLGDSGRIDAARRMAERSGGSARSRAVLACLSWYDHDDTSQALADEALASTSDLVVAMLAGPVAMWGGDGIASAAPPLRFEADAVAARRAGAPGDIEGFAAAGDAWVGVAERGRVRCGWAAADAAAAQEDERAARLTSVALALVSDVGLHAFDGRLAPLARRFGIAAAAISSTRVATDVLSAREAEVLACVADGLTTVRIARRLGIAPNTVASHIRSSITKLGSANRREAAARYASMVTEGAAS